MLTTAYFLHIFLRLRILLCFCIIAFSLPLFASTTTFAQTMQKQESPILIESTHSPQSAQFSHIIESSPLSNQSIQSAAMIYVLPDISALLQKLMAFIREFIQFIESISFTHHIDLAILPHLADLWASLDSIKADLPITADLKTFSLSAIKSFTTSSTSQSIQSSQDSPILSHSSHLPNTTKSCENLSLDSIRPISLWANAYTMKQDSILYLAPSPACPSSHTLSQGTEITAISQSRSQNGDYLYIKVQTQDKSELYGYIAADSAYLNAFSFDFYFTLVCMVLVLLLGRYLISKSKILRDYNIPEPVVGGIIAAIGILCVYQFLHIEFKFDSSLKDPLMLAFFSSVGLSADFASLKKGGRMLFIFLFLVSGLLFLQNLIGIGVSVAMGQSPLLGLLGGSITMSGGHGTGGAWADVFKNAPYHFAAATEVAMACATFGLVMGGLIGGPVARFLIKKHHLKIPGKEHNNDDPHGFETPSKERLITPISFVESLALIALCLLIGNLLSDYMKGVVPSFNLPTFVYCLFTGVILRNVLGGLKIHKVFDREVSVLGNVSLSLFLAFAMMSLNLWELVALALPMIVILATQALTMIAFAVFITFRFCGRDYDAAVLAAGHCGFGLGATPTAMVNMQTVTSHYGPSHMAFIVVPLVGAFFIDLINAVVIQTVLQILF